MTTVIENEVQRVALLNKERLANAKKEPSHGLNLLIQALLQANRESVKLNARDFRTPVKKTVTVYFSRVTANRFAAYIIIHNELQHLNIPEAGHRLHANYKDGYQANGGQYSKPDHILDAMVVQVKKLAPALVEDNGRIRAQLI